LLTGPLDQICPGAILKLRHVRVIEPDLDSRWRRVNYSFNRVIVLHALSTALETLGRFSILCDGVRTTATRSRHIKSRAITPRS
jgi:hypothetical protein